ncbi:hypothetical protein J3E71DRAFT_237733 [Bipolaris maydis]|nr:hypothetical protein J3E71DRAFT_237733 [Bipolaris maydis]
MDARFEARMRMYMGERVMHGSVERERGQQKEMKGLGKRKRDEKDVDEEGEEKEEETNRQEKGKAEKEGRPRKLTVKLKFTACPVVRSDKDKPSSSPSSSSPPSSPPYQPSQFTRTQTPTQAPQPQAQQTGPSKVPTRQSTRNQPAPTTTPMPPSHLRITNEAPIPWAPIPLPCALLPDDHEGARAAWKRLFPHEAPLGEYGGKPTGWMAKMTWKKGRGWVEREEADVYVERFLGRVPTRSEEGRVRRG